MSRRHADPIEVRSRDGVPEQFLWRSRLHVIRAVLEHWFESGQWWESARAMALTAGTDVPSQAPQRESGELLTAPIPASPKWAQHAWGEPAPDVGAAVG